jgi:hypothetical protein
MGNSPALPTNQTSTTAESASAIKGIFWRNAATSENHIARKTPAWINWTQRPILTGNVTVGTSLGGFIFCFNFSAQLRDKPLTFQHRFDPDAEFGRSWPVL